MAWGELRADSELPPWRRELAERLSEIKQRRAMSEEASGYEAAKAAAPAPLTFQIVKSVEGWELTIGSTTRIYARLKGALDRIKLACAALDGNGEEKA